MTNVVVTELEEELLSLELLKDVDELELSKLLDEEEDELELSELVEDELLEEDELELLDEEVDELELLEEEDDPVEDELEEDGHLIRVSTVGLIKLPSVAGPEVTTPSHAAVRSESKKSTNERASAGAKVPGRVHVTVPAATVQSPLRGKE